MVHARHIGQLVTYRGKALNFPRGITFVNLKLAAIGECGDAWLETTPGSLIGVLVEDCFPTYTAPFIVDPEFDSWKLEPFIPNPYR